MNKNEVYLAELNKIRKSSMIEVNESCGLIGTSGYKGILVTKEKELYQYQFYYNTTNSYIKNVRKLSNEEYKELTDFIEKEIINKEYETIEIFDARFELHVHYQGIKKTIINNIGVDNKLGIYDKTKHLLENFKEK